MRFLLAILFLTIPATTLAGAFSQASEENAQVALHPVVRVALEPQQRPDINKSQANPVVDNVLRLLSKRTELKFEYVVTDSWQASLDAFRTGKVDALVSLSDVMLGADLEKHALISSPYYQGATVIVTRRDGPAAFDNQRFDGKTITFKGGGIYEAWLTQHQPGVKRLPLTDLSEVLAAVESGLADAAIGIDMAYGPVIRRDFAASLQIIGSVAELPIAVRFIVPPDQPRLLETIEKGMSAITSDEYESLVHRWIEVAYFKAPSLSMVAFHYGKELALAALLLIIMSLAVIKMRWAQLTSHRREQQKTMLLAVVSHEVRNAVNAVSVSVDLLSRSKPEALSDQQQKLLATAQASSHDLLQLLHHTLDFVRQETQASASEQTACDVLGVARHCIEAARPTIEAKHLKVNLELPFGPMPWLLLDEGRFRQVLHNLLSNAVKFTSKGRVGIALWHEPAAGVEIAPRLIVEVFDTGIGIPIEQQADLFKPFTQVNRSLSTQLGGAGLGLSICHNLIQQMSGRLSVTSKVDIGTSVRVELPAAATSRTDVEPGEASEFVSPIGHIARGRILLVEDHPANQKTIRAQLSYLGFDSMAVSDGQAALEAMAREDFAAVLLDCELPDMEGYDVAKEQRRRETTEGRPPTCFIAISAKADSPHARQCEESGIDLVLGKPLSLERLEAVLISREAVSESEDARWGEFREMTGEDIAQMRQALDASDRTALARLAHRVKGGALMFGAYRLVVIAEDIEMAVSTNQDVEQVSRLLSHFEMAWRGIDHPLGGTFTSRSADNR